MSGALHGSLVGWVCKSPADYQGSCVNIPSFHCLGFAVCSHVFHASGPLYPFRCLALERTFEADVQV